MSTAPASAPTGFAARRQLRRPFRAEAEATISFGVGLGVGALVGLIVFWGANAPLWGGWSIGAVAAITVTGVGLVTSFIEYWRSRYAAGQEWRLGIRSWTFIVDSTAVAIVHAGLAMVLTVAAFDILQKSFVGFEADTFVAMVGVGLSAGLAAYWIAVSSQSITTQRMTGLLVSYMALSVFASMLTVEHENWWHYHFSALGAFGDASSLIFNSTLIIAGAMVTVFAVYLERDLRLLAEHGRLRRPGAAKVVAVVFVIMGIMLAGVGVVNVSINETIHVTFASGMFVCFILMLIAGRWLFDGLPWTVHIITWVFLAAILVAVVLYYPIGYFNLAAMEMVAFALVFGWIVVFIRLETAAQASVESP